MYTHTLLKVENIKSLAKFHSCIQLQQYTQPQQEICHVNRVYSQGIISSYQYNSHHVSEGNQVINRHTTNPVSNGHIPGLCILYTHQVLSRRSYGFWAVVSKCDGSRSLAAQGNGAALGSVNPYISVMSTSSGFMSPGNDQSKECNRLAKMNCTVRIPIDNPGHTRRPAPKGSSWKCRPLTSTSLRSACRNRSGLKTRGSCHMAGSRWIA